MRTPKSSRPLTLMLVTSLLAAPFIAAAVLADPAGDALDKARSDAATFYASQYGTSKKFVDDTSSNTGKEYGNANANASATATDARNGIGRAYTNGLGAATGWIDAVKTQGAGAYATVLADASRLARDDVGGTGATAYSGALKTTDDLTKGSASRAGSAYTSTHRNTLTLQDGATGIAAEGYASTVNGLPANTPGRALAQDTNAFVASTRDVVHDAGAKTGNDYFTIMEKARADAASAGQHVVAAYGMGTQDAKAGVTEAGKGGYAAYQGGTNAAVVTTRTTGAGAVDAYLKTGENAQTLTRNAGANAVTEIQQTVDPALAGSILRAPANDFLHALNSTQARAHDAGLYATTNYFAIGAQAVNETRKAGNATLDAYFSNVGDAQTALYNTGKAGAIATLAATNATEEAARATGSAAAHAYFGAAATGQDLTYTTGRQTVGAYFEATRVGQEVAYTTGKAGATATLAGLDAARAGSKGAAGTALGAAFTVATPCSNNAAGGFHVNGDAQCTGEGVVGYDGPAYGLNGQSGTDFKSPIDANMNKPTSCPAGQFGFVAVYGYQYFRGGCYAFNVEWIVHSGGLGTFDTVRLDYSPSTSGPGTATLSVKSAFESMLGFEVYLGGSALVYGVNWRHEDRVPASVVLQLTGIMLDANGPRLGNQLTLQYVATSSWLTGPYTVATTIFPDYVNGPENWYRVQLGTHEMSKGEPPSGMTLALDLGSNSVKVTYDTHDNWNEGYPLKVSFPANGGVTEILASNVPDETVIDLRWSGINKRTEISGSIKFPTGRIGHLWLPVQDKVVEFRNLPAINSLRYVAVELGGTGESFCSKKIEDNIAGHNYTPTRGNHQQSCLWADLSSPGAQIVMDEGVEISTLPASSIELAIGPAGAVYYNEAKSLLPGCDSYFNPSAACKSVAQLKIDDTPEFPQIDGLTITGLKSLLYIPAQVVKDDGTRMDMKLDGTFHDVGTLVGRILKDDKESSLFTLDFSHLRSIVYRDGNIFIRFPESGGRFSLRADLGTPGAPKTVDVSGSNLVSLDIKQGAGGAPQLALLSFHNIQTAQVGGRFNYVVNGLLDGRQFKLSGHMIKDVQQKKEVFANLYVRDDAYTAGACSNQTLFGCKSTVVEGNAWSLKFRWESNPWNNEGHKYIVGYFWT